MSKKNHYEEFMYKMGISCVEKCDGQCINCKYFYEIDDKKQRFRCFRKDVANYITYQAEKHQ